MTREEIEKTAWAQRYRQECPDSYQEAVEYATCEGMHVDVYQTNVSGIKKWIIEIDGIDFCLDIFPTKKQAMNLCKEMKWKVV